MLPTSPLTWSQPAFIRGLDDYQLEGIWWEQPYAVIYRGRRISDRLAVLVKLSKDLSASGLGSDWLQRDYEIAQRLSAQCAVKPFALERTDLGPALIYADEGAQPLEGLAVGAPLDIGMVLTIGAGLAEAVGALHREQLVHCNLNTTTVWLNDAGGIRISEFGCAKHPSKAAFAGLYSFNGPIDIRYVSPEQTGRIQRSVDQRTDLYSLGVILFRLLTGRVPFDGTDPLHIIDGHVARPPRFPAQLYDTLHPGLTGLVLKALAKSPEARYQSASGLLADLLECASQWRCTGIIKEFELGRQDARGVLHIPRCIYGRERETAALFDKARAVQRGQTAILLVKGAPGVGKSALLSQLEGFVRKGKGRFVSGKFDQFKRNVPYLALIQAFQQLIGQILGENEERTEAWRSRILEATGNSARVVIDVIPELERITGPQPPVPALPPIQTRNRFKRVLTNLIQVLATSDQPLCVVMDDLQWVDAASLGLLSHVLRDSNTRNILFAGAYRDTEVGPTHPLELTISALQQSGVDIQVLELNELKESDLLLLVRDAFDETAPNPRDLAHALYSRTGGNPLYVTQLLHLLYDNGLIAFDYQSGKWDWDLLRIQQEGVTQDVLDLLSLRFGSLHEDTRTVLATAACVGSSFEVGKVAIAAERPLSEVLQALLIAAEQGLIISLNGTPSGADPPDDGGARRFRFVHDRIQQAALACVPRDAEKEFRLQIGRRLMATLTADDELVPQPDILSNLNHSWDLLQDEGERQRVARLNLVAGRRARQALAYKDALSYITAGLDLLGATAWETCHDLAFELCSEALECEYLTGNFGRADELFQLLVRRARSKLEKARAYLTRILLDTSEERYEEAVKVGTEALNMFGIRYLRNPSRVRLGAELVLARLRMRGREPQDLFEIKSLDDPAKVAALRILVALFPTAYFISPDLYLFTGLKVVNYSLRHGISPLSAGGFVTYGLALGTLMDDYKRGHDFGRFALELAEKGKNPLAICKVLFLFGGFINAWRNPVKECFPLFDRAQSIAIEVGDYQFANYAMNSNVWGRFFGCGRSLHELLRQCEEYQPLVMHSKEASSIETFTMLKHCMLALRGETTKPHSLTGSGYNEDVAERHYRHSGNLHLVSLQNILRLTLACIFNRYEDALSLSRKGEAVIRSSTGIISVADYYLYRGIAAASALIKQDGSTFKNRRTLRRCLRRLRVFAANSPHNFRQHEALLEGDAAWTQGRPSEALKHYNRAIELAEAEGFTHLVALANEHAALCCIADKQIRLASWYLACSRAAYDKWGATAKVAQLDSEFAAHLRLAANRQHEMRASHDAPVIHQGDSFDLATALRAARIIEHEEDTNRVLTHLMQVVRVQAGAETAQLWVLEGGKLRLEASAAAHSGDVLLFPSSSEAGSELVSPAILNYVLHTGDDLFLADAGTDPRFTQCTYLASRHPKSVICSGIHHQGELLGIIYLEHTEIAGAFNEQKFQWLRLLAAEVGLTIRSARLSRYRDYVHKFAPTAVSSELDTNPENPNLAAKDCDVSVLFADLAGYTRMAELLERRQLDELLNRAFAEFVDEIHRYQGILLEIRGDELMVLFNDEDPSRHACKAAYAALAISHAATHLSKKLSGYPLPVVMNMGINSGVVQVGLQAIEASSGSAWHYGATGSVVNIAARVRERARNGAILMSADSAARVKNDFVLEDLGEHKLKNVSAPLRIYRLVGEA